MITAASKENRSLLLVGNAGIIHIGNHFLRAAQGMSLKVDFCNCEEAFSGAYVLSKLKWWFGGHRPNKLGVFSRKVVALCNETKPHWLIATGMMPLEKGALEEIKKTGALCGNYLTDDPWNPAHRAAWFMKTLPLYDHIFSPRKANIPDLKGLGCAHVSYLPFAYAPQIHFPESAKDEQERSHFNCDVAFIGGADHDRLPYIEALAGLGIDLHLYGGYWDRYPRFRKYACGNAEPRALRLATQGAKIVLGLVRQANRDGHSMRTFEAPAMNACLLLEETQEHKEFFGEDKERVVYFNGLAEMVEKTKWLLAHEEERLRLRRMLHAYVTEGHNTYKDRLCVMLETIETGSSRAVK